MNEGHREVVILKFSHWRGFSPGDNEYRKLETEIRASLGKWLFINNTGKRLGDVPLSEMLQNQGVVLPVMDVDFKSSDGFYTYRDWDASRDVDKGQLNVYDRYANKAHFRTMKEDQLRKFADYDGRMERDRNVPCDLFLLSWTLTTPFFPYQVAPAAGSELASTMRTIGKNAHGFIPNIIYVDFYESADPTDVAISMNSRL